jgi:hypothetical protein
MAIHTDASSQAPNQSYTVQPDGNGNFVFTSGGDGFFGTYTYQVTGSNTAHMVLTYAGQYTGDYDDMTLTFTGANTGTITGTQKVTGVVGPINGTFTY